MNVAKNKGDASLINSQKSSSGNNRIGGVYSGDEIIWINSLNETNWGYIEYQNPISIFQLLIKRKEYEYLRKEIFLAIGKRILYSGIETYKFSINENSKKLIIFKSEKIPSEIEERKKLNVIFLQQLLM